MGYIVYSDKYTKYQFEDGSQMDISSGVENRFLESMQFSLSTSQKFEIMGMDFEKTFEILEHKKSEKCSKVLGYLTRKLEAKDTGEEHEIGYLFLDFWGIKDSRTSILRKLRNNKIEIRTLLTLEHNIEEEFITDKD